MAKFRVQTGCELMLQPLPEKPLVDTKDFRVVHDANSDAIVFGLGMDGTLILVAKDGHGNNTLVDLRKQFELSPDEAVSAIGVHQDMTTRAIHLAFGTKLGNAGNIYIAAPLSAKTLSNDKPWYHQFNKSILLKGPESANFISHNFMFVSGRAFTCLISLRANAGQGTTVRSGEGFPFLAVVRSIPQQTAKDVSRLDVDLTTRKWSWATDFNYPYNFDDMRDFCAGAVLPSVSGVFGLSLTLKTPQLTFASQLKGGPDGGVINTNLAYPEDPRCIAACAGNKGLTEIFVGGSKGILRIPAGKATGSYQGPQPCEPTLVDPLLHGLSQIHVTQDLGESAKIVIWALNGDGNVVYLPAQFTKSRADPTGEVAADGPAVPLLSLKSLQQRTGSKEPKRVVRFNALIHPDTGARQIFILTTDGQVSWLQQEPVSHLWSEQQFQIPDDSDVSDVNTYTCHLSVLDDQNLTQPEIELSLKASSHTRATINGRGFHLSTEARRVKTDTNGTLTIIMPANTLTVPDIEVTGDHVVSCVLHPSDKAMDKLATATQGDSLQKAKKPDGSLVFPKLEKANADILKKVGDAYKEQKNKGQKPSEASKRSIPTHRGLGDIIQAGWEMLHGLKETAEGLLNVVVEKGRLAFEAVVNGVKKAYNFVIETIEHALAAIGALLEWLAEKIEDALVWLASKLDWSNILVIKDVFNELILTTLDAGSSCASHGKDIVDKFFDDVERHLDSDSLTIPPAVPDKLKPSMSPSHEGQKKDEYTDNPCFNWAKYQITHGSVKSSTNQVSGQGQDAMTELMSDVYSTVLEPIWGTIETLFNAIMKDLNDAFTSNKSFIEVLQHVGKDVLKGILRALRIAVTKIMGALSKIFDWMKDILGKHVHIYVVTKLYKKITPNHEQLDVLNLFSLLLAVPTSWIYKLTTGDNVKDDPKVTQFLADARNKKWDSLPNPVPSKTSSRVARDSTAEWSPPHEFLKLIPPGTTLKWNELYPTAFMVICTGKAAYTLGDMIYTAIKWPKALQGGGRGTFEIGFGFWAALFNVGFSFPLKKAIQSNRPTMARNLRLWSWIVTSPLNILKSGSVARAKPVISIINGIVDMSFYTTALFLEQSTDGSDDDSVMEITNRMQSIAWALTSGANGLSGGKNPYGLAVAAVLAVTFNGQNIYILTEQWKYWKAHDSKGKDPWHPPDLSTSIHGSF